MIPNMARERTMHKLLERQAAKYGERTYMYFEDKEFSFKQVDHAAKQVACGLQKLGIVQGDKVAIVMNNCPEVIFIMFGLSKLGVVGVPINIFHKGEVMNYMVDHSDSSMLFMHSHHIDRLGPVLQKTTKIKSVVVLEEDSNDQKPGDNNISVAMVKEQIEALGKQAMEWSEFIDNNDGYQPADVIWSDPLMLLYTSGTTGLSKGVLMPHNFFYCMAERYFNWVLEQDLNENDCIYLPANLFHAHIWHCGINHALLRGASIVIPRRFSASKFWDDIKRYGCKYAAAGGAVFSILRTAEPKDDDADNPLRVCFGSNLTKELCDEVEPRFGIKIYEFYGSTELGAPAMNRISDRKIGSCGRLLSDFAVKLVDENGVEVGTNTPGEILVRLLKPYAMLLEYYKMPEKTVEAFKDLWFHTGDFGRFDEDGYLFFVDRKKDSIRRRSENISSFEVERVINSHPAVLESAVYAVKSDLTEDDDVMVSLTLRPGEDLLPEDLLSFCETQMAYFMVPRYVRFVDGLPRNAVNRVEKFKLREEGITPDTWDREKVGYKLKR